MSGLILIYTVTVVVPDLYTATQNLIGGMSSNEINSQPNLGTMTGGMYDYPEIEQIREGNLLSESGITNAGKTTFDEEQAKPKYEDHVVNRKEYGKKGIKFSTYIDKAEALANKVPGGDIIRSTYFEEGIEYPNYEHAYDKSTNEWVLINTQINKIITFFRPSSGEQYFFNHSFD